VAKKKDAAGKPAKTAKAKNGAKKSKIPRPVQNRGFALFGLLALLPIALLLLKGKLDLESAAQRAVIVLIGVMLLERVVGPLVLAVLTSGEKKDEKNPDGGQPELTSAEG
jgi:hypothetical protein